MTPQQLQSLRNLGNECEEAADEIESLQARCKALEAAQAWRTIETAPRDGTPVFITAAYDVVGDQWSGCVPAVARWVDAGGKFGWLWAVPDLSAVHGYLTEKATHWMPLPAPPKP